MVYSDARYCAGRNHRDKPRHGRLPRNRAGAKAEIRSTGGRIARCSQMVDPPCRPQRLSRQEADLNAANAAAPGGGEAQERRIQTAGEPSMLQSSSTEMVPRYR